MKQTTAPIAIERLIELRNALHLMPPDWLLEQRIETVELGWQAHAKFLYPAVMKAWGTTGQKTPKPHGGSPLCKFTYLALKSRGEPVKSAKAVADFLENADMTLHFAIQEIGVHLRDT